MRRSGSRIRVTAQLIRADDESQLWSERYDRDMTDVFAVQDEIGKAISEALKVRLAPRTPTLNIEAWHQYLRGQHYRNRLTPDSLAKAKEHYERALAVDPNFALGYASLASYYYALGVLAMKPVAEVAPLSKSAGEQALAIDPSNNDANSVMGTLAGFFDYDWKVAGMHHRKVMAPEPVPPMVRFRYAQYYLLPLGRVKEATEQSRQALETDPLSIVLQYGVTFSLYTGRHYEDAIRWARRAMEIEANFYPLCLAMGLAQIQAGYARGAIASFKRVVELAPWYSDGAWLLAAAYHRAGDRERNQEWTRKLANSNSNSYLAAWYYASVGEADAMFDALEGAYRQRFPRLPTIAVEPPFRPLSR